MTFNTFDNANFGRPDQELGDVVEIGENNDVWFRLVRSTKVVEVVAKTTGLVTRRQHISRTALVHDELLTERLGMTPGQINALKHALQLRD